MSIRLITFSGQTVTPKTDGIIQDASIGQNGIFYGCSVTASGNSLHIDGGYGLIKGRYFEIDATTVPVTLATSDTLLGRLYVKLDLSNTEAPIRVLTATGETLPSLEQDVDANFDDGVWEMELATFNITTTEISDLAETYQTITDNASLVSALQSAVDTLNSNLQELSNKAVKVENTSEYITCNIVPDQNNSILIRYNKSSREIRLFGKVNGRWSTNTILLGTLNF